MGLTEIVMIRLTAEQRKVLRTIALENGVHESAFCRNVIGLAIMPKPKKSTLEKIMDKVKAERKLLYSGNRKPRKKRKKNDRTE